MRFAFARIVGSKKNVIYAITALIVPQRGVKANARLMGLNQKINISGDTGERRIMSRLTERAKNGKAVYCHPTSDPKGWDDNRSAVLERCCQYKDTGLSPKEIMDGKMLTGWIPVGERQPEIGAPVVITLWDKSVTVGTWYGHRWGTALCHHGDVLAWMPMPEPYKPAN